MNESTDNDGFTLVLGHGHRAKNPECMRALALSTADSDDEAVLAHPHHQPSQHTKVKSSSLNTANSFESLDVEDISDPNDANYKTDEELPDLLSGSNLGSDSAEETDGSDIEEITNTEVSFSFQMWHSTDMSLYSLHNHFLPKLFHSVARQVIIPAPRQMPNERQPTSLQLQLQLHLPLPNDTALPPLRISKVRASHWPVTLLSLPLVVFPKYVILLFFNLVNVNLLRSRSFEVAWFISFMRRYQLTLKGPLASLATNISSVFTEAGRY